MEHMVRRGATYHYRRRIPTDLVDALDGKREVTFSLKTKDKREAAARARKESVRLDEEWAAVRRTRALGPVPTDHDLVEVLGKVMVVPPPKSGWPEPETISAEELARCEAEEHADQQEAEENERREEAANAEAERLIAALRARGLVRVAGPEDANKAEPPTPQQKAVTLESLISHWQRECKPTTKAVQSATRTVIEFDNLHKDPPVQSITRAMIVKYRDWLMGQKLSVKTINDGRLTYIRILLGVALDRGLVSVNHGAGTSLRPDKEAKGKRPVYSPEQAAAVLKDTERYKDSHPARYWLPRLAKWTGARLNELHQLRKMDLLERDGYRGICITDKGECMPGLPMRLKNTGSRRWVPLHAEVAAFWDWAQGRPDGALFPAKPDVHGIISAAFSKWYGRQRATWGIKDKGVVFHSWRHLFADKCRIAGVTLDMRLALMGHSEGGTAGGYGSGQLPAKVLAEAIAKLSA